MMIPFTRIGITGGAQVEEKDDEFTFDLLNLRGPCDIWVHLAVGYIDLPSGREGRAGEMERGGGTGEPTSICVVMTGRDESTQEESVVELRRGRSAESPRTQTLRG